MAAQKVRLRTNAWYGDQEIALDFPANWEVVECRMAGHDRPALSDEGIRAALANPIGSPRLSELARGKREAVILFDDLPKPTPAWRVAPFVLEELHAGGIRDDQIRFLCAPGTHRPLPRAELVAKLGADIVARYPVYNHSIWTNLTHVGTTSAGTPIHVNREFASCDLRVAIGSLIPHPMAGFGGGGKIIMPGIAGIETITVHHKRFAPGPGNPTVQVGRVHDNAARLDLEAAARLAGLHFKVDSILNNHREVVGLFAGDFVAAHRAGARLAREVYATNFAKDADVLVSNTYPDEHQFTRSVRLAAVSVREGGDVVLINCSEDGQVLHQYRGRFGTEFGGPGWVPGGRARIAKARRVLVLAPLLSMNDCQELGGPEKVIWCREWGEVLAELMSAHGPGTRVVVHPYAPLQLAAE